MVRRSVAPTVPVTTTESVFVAVAPARHGHGSEEKDRSQRP